MDRCSHGEELFRQKFLTYGLADGFEFIRRDWSSDHGRKVYVKCKSCGETFLTYSVYDVFKKHAKRLSCKLCGAASDGGEVKARSPRVSDAMEYYTSGHSVKETAIRYDFTESDINNFVRRRHLSNGRDWRTAANEDRKKASEERSARMKAEAEKRNEEKRARAEQVRLEKKANAETRKIEREIFRLWYPPVDTRREALLDQTGICEICGKPYTVRGYVKSCGLKYARDNGICSSECRDEKKRRIKRELHRGRKDSHRHRARKYGCEYDPSVKLEKLIERDGLRCAICGEMCNPNDHSWSKYSGPKYPSIDHIIPMSKGGGHTWDNVQIAHIICNSEKGDKVEGVSA